MFVLTLTDDKLLKFVLIWGKSCVAFVWGRKVGLAQNPFYHTTPYWYRYLKLKRRIYPQLTTHDIFSTSFEN